ncbi:tudor domain-containing protein 3-like isoform X2 [Amphibalanus amphitrite]|uniref:tudor domain-containing protein 3-like isoform X2 n=1 Tax=Amphibalanus amphitrite TaxID=1232801 RepID=UPI001C9238D1|nr:tudor domain-containing protein 3-like isoform X2 [Amphibalanus amphitrite]
MATDIENLRKLGWYMTEAGLKKLSGGQTLSESEIIKIAQDTDIREYGKCHIPENWSKKDMVTIDGVLQVQKVRNVSAPKTNEESQAAPRLLRVTLSDGASTVTALETDPPWSRFSLRTPPGTKVRLRQPVPVCSGFLLVPDEALQVIGGTVQQMVDKWTMNKAFASQHLRPASGVAGGPPPWVPFGKSISKAHETEKDFKSLAGVSETPVDSEFEAQRQAQIAQVAGAGRKQFGGGTKQMTDANLQTLMGAGFTQEESEAALRYTGNDVGRALQNLQRYRARRDGRDDSDADTGRGRGRGRGRGGRRGRGRDRYEDEEPSTRPSEPITLLDFVSQKLGGDSSASSNRAPTPPDDEPGGATGGHSYSDRDRGYGGPGRGYSDRGRGHGGPGRGYSDSGRGHDSGRGGPDRGYDRGRSGSDRGYSDRSGPDRGYGVGRGGPDRDYSGGPDRGYDRGRGGSDRGYGGSDRGSGRGGDRGASDGGSGDRGRGGRGGRGPQRPHVSSDEFVEGRRARDRRCGAGGGGDFRTWSAGERPSSVGRGFEVYSEDRQQFPALPGGEAAGGEPSEGDSEPAAAAPAAVPAAAAPAAAPEHRYTEGEMCLATYWQDKQMYLARIVSVGERTAVVNFVDYGEHYEEVFTANMRPLGFEEEETTSTPVQSEEPCQEPRHKDFEESDTSNLFSHKRHTASLREQDDQFGYGNRPSRHIGAENGDDAYRDRQAGGDRRDRRDNHYEDRGGRRDTSYRGDRGRDTSHRGGNQGTYRDDGGRDTSYRGGNQGTYRDDGGRDTSYRGGNQGTYRDDGGRDKSYRDDRRDDYESGHRETHRSDRRDTRRNDNSESFRGDRRDTYRSDNSDTYRDDRRDTYRNDSESFRGDRRGGRGGRGRGGRGRGYGDDRPPRFQRQDRDREEGYSGGRPAGQGYQARDRDQFEDRPRRGGPRGRGQRGYEDGGESEGQRQWMDTAPVKGRPRGRPGDDSDDVPFTGTMEFRRGGRRPFVHRGDRSS